MNYQEEYDLKRNNFVEKTKKYFDFLLSEYKYNNPIYNNYIQENGFITRDTFTYQGTESNIIISNSYHPVDYGFAITIVSSVKEEIIYYKLKEEQDVEQSYLTEAANFLKNYLKGKVSA